jgi:hypothetical protein
MGNQLGSQSIHNRPTLFVSPLAIIATSPALVGAFVIVAIRIGFRLGLGLASSTAIGLIALGAIVWLCLRQYRVQFRRPPRSEIVVIGVLIILTLILWDRAANRSLFWPHAWGVDQAHHAALTTFIVDTNGPPRIVPQLGGMAGYPPGAHELAAAFSKITHVNPLGSTWFIGLGSGFAQLWVVGWLAFRLCRDARPLAAIVAVSLWLLGWRIGIGMVSESFYLSHSLTVLFGNVGLGLIFLAHRRRALWYVPIAILALASVFTYPQAAVVIPGAVVFVHFGSVRRWFAGLAPKFRLGLMTLAVVVGILGFQWARRNGSVRRAILGVGEGSVTQLEPKVIGGPLATAILAYGLFQFLRAYASGSHRAARAVIGAVAGPLLVATVFLMLRRGGLPLINYRILKNGQTVFSLLCVCGGYGVSAAATADWWTGKYALGTRQKSITTAVTLLCALAMLLRTGNASRFSSTSFPLVDRDAYTLARFAAKTYPPDEVGLAGNGLGPYTLWWAGVGRTATYQSEKLIPRMELFDSWPAGPRTERFLLVDASVRERYVNRPGVTVLYSRNGAAILTKDPA